MLRRRASNKLPGPSGNDSLSQFNPAGEQQSRSNLFVSSFRVQSSIVFCSRRSGVTGGGTAVCVGTTHDGLPISTALNWRRGVAYMRGTPVGSSSDRMPATSSSSISGSCSASVSRAWDMGAERVWIHTCTLDHSQALRNYEARGFRIFNVEEQIEELPDQKLEPYPGLASRDGRRPRAVNEVRCRRFEDGFRPPPE
jgi:hypothetical protein